MQVGLFVGLLTEQRLSLTLMPPFGTHCSYWIASSSVNRRSFVSLLLDLPWLADIHGRVVCLYLKTSSGGVVGWGGWSGGKVKGGATSGGGELWLG